MGNGSRALPLGAGNWRIISTLNVWILTGVLVLALIIGSFADYRISFALHNQDSAFGQVFAAFGEFPSYLAAVAVCCFLLIGHNRERPVIAVLQVVAAVVVLVIGIRQMIIVPKMYLVSTNPVILYVASGVLIVIVAVLAIAVARGADRAMIIRVAGVIAAAVILEIVAVYLIKSGWGRPRMRLIEESTVDFAPWWNIGNEAKAEYVAAGTPSEEFRSFPSGHTACAADLILVTAVIPLRKSLERYSSLLFWIGASWGMLVALSRIVMGAHFVSDTVVGYSISFAATLIVYRIAFARPLAGMRGETELSGRLPAAS